MYSYIYEVTNLITNKIYISQKHSNIFLDKKYLGSGKLIRMIMDKYRKDNFKERKFIHKDELNFYLQNGYLPCRGGK